MSGVGHSEIEDARYKRVEKRNRQQLVNELLKEVDADCHVDSGRLDIRQEVATEEVNMLKNKGNYDRPLPYPPTNH